jgi:hypothetical protein
MAIPEYVPILTAVVGTVLGTVIGFNLNFKHQQREKRKQLENALLSIGIELISHKDILSSYLTGLRSKEEAFINGYGVVDLVRDKRLQLFIDYVAKTEPPKCRTEKWFGFITSLKGAPKNYLAKSIYVYEDKFEYFFTLYNHIIASYQKERNKNEYGIISSSKLELIYQDCITYLARLDDLVKAALYLSQEIHQKLFDHSPGIVLSAAVTDSRS